MCNCVLCDEIIPYSAMNGYKVEGFTIRGVYQCPHCRAVQGQCYLGDSYSIVKPLFGENLVDAEKKQVYFDLTCLGSAGITRRHGWFDPASRFLIQVG